MPALVDFSNSLNEETSGTVYAMPATPLQVRLWNLNRTAGSDPAWNVAVRFRLSGHLDREKLECSLQMLTNRHEALRTSLELHHEILVQRIAARVTLPVEWCDLRSVSAEAQAVEVQCLSLAHARQILPLDGAPLLRARILRLNDEEHLLLWNAHHGICDGWSVGLLASELMECYGQLLSGREPEMRSSLDYGDYAVWLETQRGTPEYEGHRNYWKRKLRGFEVPELPASWRNSDPVAAASAIFSTVLPREMTDRLAAIAQNHHATFFHAVLAAFALFMRVHQEHAEVALGTPLTGRDQAELENIVGTFVNYLPLRFHVDEETSYSALLHDVRDLVTDSLEHAQFRYEDMLADLKKDAASPSGENGLFSIAFICQQDFVHPKSAGGLSLTAVPSVSPGALHPLTVFMVERAEGWRLSCEVDGRVVSGTAGSALLEGYRQLLGAIAADPQGLVAIDRTRAGLSSGHKNDSNRKRPPDNVAASQLSTPNAEEYFAMENARGLMRIPATEFQRRFWRLDQMNPGGTAFHVRIRLEMKGPLNMEALAGAVKKLAGRHEILRTTLEESGGQIWQVVHPELPLDFRFLSSESLAPGALRATDQRMADQAILDREGEVGFSLTAGPLFRTRVLQLEKERHWLAITLSHGIVDGWSTGLFLEQLQQAYEENLAGAVGETKVLPVQFSAHGKAERSLLAGREKDRRLTWWREYLEGVWTPLALPRDLDESAGDGDVRATLETVLLPSEASSLARRFARECQTTLFAVFGALFQALLAHYSGEKDVLFLTPHANRTGNSETIMGPLADPLCLTGRIDAQTTFRQLTTRLSEQSMDAMENALPLNIVTPLVDMRVERRYHPLNQITFFYQRAFVHDMAWKNLQVRSLPDVPSVTSSEWQLGVVERSGEIFLEFLYDATLYSPATIQTVVRHYISLLALAVLEPDTALSQLQILAPEEVEQQSAESLPLPVVQSLPSRPHVAAADIQKLVEDKNAVPAADAPLSQSERDMVRIWRQLFKIDGLNVESNFFDLGGHSLLLARLQIVMKREFNVQLAAADVFRHPTVAMLAGWLEHAQAEVKPAAKQDSGHSLNHDPRIIPIQPLGTERPIFVISQSMVFRTLSEELGPNQPVYSLQMLDEDITPAMASASFEELAGFYARLIRQIQPQGPYRLSGWCLAGWIAYEVARQLEQDGAEIEMLMIMDVWGPGYWRNQSRIRGMLMEAVYRGKRFLYSGRRLLRGNSTQRSDYIRRNLHGMAASAARTLTVRLHRLNLPVQVRLTEEMRRTELLEYTASRTYDAGPLKGTVLLLRSERHPAGPLLAPDMGWAKVLGRSVSVGWLPGSEIFDHAGSRVMAARVREVLGLAPTAVLPGDIAESQHGIQNFPLVEDTCVH